jgi:RHS repeat-associated protein
MKKFYLSLLFLGFSFFVSAQDLEGIPVKGLKPIKRMENTPEKTANTTSQMAETTKILPVSVIAPTGNSTEVGITEGQLSVSLSGGANYAIPIAMPPGINGVVPQISLAYNSQGGNGMAGYGWNITGISSITRIPATKFHDGIIDGVDFNSLDRFAFDGQRLIVKNGTNGIYGANGTTYETEGFSNVKITSYGVHPNGANFGPEYFIVEYPDGSKAYYGNLIDTRTVTDWAIAYWENPQGVRINYNYILANNNLSIEYIKYGGTNTNAPINQIQFIYKPRQRPEQAYVGGHSFLRNTIVSEIKVTANGAGFRNYDLAHNVTSLGYERLMTITEKSGDNSKNYNPTVFNYEDTPETISYNSVTSSLSIGNISLQNAATVSGDFDGDGKMDFLLYPSTGPDSRAKYWLFSDITSSTNLNLGWEHAVGRFDDIFPVSWLSWSNKLMPMQGWTVIKSNGSVDGSTIFTTYSAGTTSPIYFQYEKAYQFPKLIYYNDYNCNGDGNEPMLQKAKILNRFNTPIEEEPPVPVELDIPKSFVNGDFNGDGLTDVVAIEKPMSYYYNWGCYGYSATRPGGSSHFINLDRRLTTDFVNQAGYLRSNETSKFMVADFNGDGKSDIYVFDTGFLKVYTLDHAQNFVLLYENTTTDSSITLDKPVLIGDYNGDGKADFIIPKGYGNNYTKYISTGVSFIRTDVTYNIPYNQNDARNTYHIIPNDLNSDGKTDLTLVQTYRKDSNFPSVHIGSVSVSLFKNINSNFVLEMTKDSGTKNNIAAYPLPIFLTSDKPNKSLEISFISNNQIHHFQSQKDFNKDRLLNTITTGNGVTESITYQPLDSNLFEGYNPIYTNSGYTENFPNTDIVVAPTFQVVTKLEKQSSAVYKKQLFSYYGAVSNTEGLGFLGFRATMRTNWHDDNTTIMSSVSKFDVNLRGANTENYSVLNLPYLSGNYTPTDFISKSVLTYESELLANKVFKIKNTIAKQYNGVDNTNSETTTVYDTYNNPTQSTTSLKEGGTTVQTSVSNVGYDNQPTGSTYYFGRPTSKTQSVTASGETITSEELYAYTGHLLSEIKKKGHNTAYITEDNLYDPFGNITKKTITAGSDTRVTNYEYDSSGRFLIKSIDIEGLASTFVYNPYNGLLNSETNPYGLTTSYSYDPWFKKIKTTDYLGKSNVYTYTRSGEETIITTTGDDDSTSQEIFDDLGRKITAGVKDINGNFSTVSYLYDIYDRNYKVSEPYFDGNPTQWNETQYDVYGRPIQTISFTGKTTTIGYSGLTTTVNDGVKTKTSTKNAIGNLITMTDSPGGTINYTYFANGNLKTTNYDGVITTIEQDGWGKKIKLTDPSAGTYSYTYNLLGETTSETTPNGTTTYILDAAGKLTKKTIIGTNTNSETTYNYDTATKLPTSNVFKNNLEGNAITNNTYEYDSYKRLFKTTETTPYATFIKQFTFDSFGRTEKESSTAVALTNGKTSVKTIKNTYKNGSPWQILDDANSQVLWQTNTTNARGQLITATMGNGIALTNTYDSFGFATQFKHDRVGSNPSNIMTLNTVFDVKKGNLSSRTNSLFSTNETFEYDDLDRLTKWDKEPLLLFNNTFNSDTGDFEPTYVTATILNQNGALKVTTTDAYSGASKVLLTNAKVEDALVMKININKGNTDKLRIMIVEEDPASGQWNQSFKGYAGIGDLTITHTVSQYPKVSISISKEVTSTDLGTPTNFYVDNLLVTYLATESQTYDDRGRITKNNVGDYNYTNTAKPYQNTSVTLAPETTAYYKNREGIFNDGMEEQKGWDNTGLDPWAVYEQATITYDASNVKTGKYSLKLSNPGATEKVIHTDKWIAIDNATDTQYTYSAWVYTDNPEAQMFLFMKTEKEQGYLTQVDNVSTSIKNQWVKIEKTFLVPANIKKLNLRLDNNGLGNVWFDDVQIRKTSNTPLSSTTFSDRQLNITYNTFKSPVQIEETGVDKISFTYNDGNDRSTIFYGGLEDDKLLRQYRKHYSADGTMEIKQNTTTGAVEFVTYIGGDGYSAPIVLKSDGETQNYLYLHRDYQGSILAITDATGAVLEKRLFDAWGNVAKVQDGAGNTLNGLTILDRGYTGHEHLQSVGLIHMNGRLYDAKLHRFLQPDNFVQDPTNTQNFNRYGYVLNNPLKYTDPSGEKWKIKLTWSDLFASVSIVAGAALSVFGGPAGAALGTKLIVAGATHFLATAAIVISDGKSWVEASNYVGFQSPTISINTGWGDSKSETNGVTQNVPVVKPKRDSSSGQKNDGYKWENSDGYVTVEEAINTWRYGLGKQNIDANISKLDLSKVHVSNFPKGEGSTIWVNFASKKYYTNANQAIVYGSISLTLMEGNKVFVPYQDKYDFDIRGNFGSIKRDFLTVWGNMYNSFGTPYYITINGVTTIKP